MPLEIKYPWSSYDVKGGLLSDTMLFGMSYELKNRSSAKITFLVEGIFRALVNHYKYILTIREWAQKI